MGTDKAGILVDGEPLAVRIAKELLRATDWVTVLGRSPIAGCEFLPDPPDSAGGPLRALARFSPKSEYVFVASCDLPLFDSTIVAALQNQIGRADCAAPILSSQIQPLCALYRAGAFEHARSLVQAGESRVMAWVALLDLVTLDEVQHPEMSLAKNVNSPQELQACRRATAESEM